VILINKDVKFEMFEIGAVRMGWKLVVGFNIEIKLDGCDFMEDAMKED
jgi:hypothetical protein